MIPESVKPCTVIVLGAYHCSTHCDTMPSTYISRSSDFVIFYADCWIKVRFAVAVIPANVKPCKVNVFNVLFQHALWTGTPTYSSALQWFYHNVTSTLAFFACFYASDICNHQAIHSVCPKCSLWSDAFDLNCGTPESHCPMQWCDVDFLEILVSINRILNYY